MSDDPLPGDDITEKVDITEEEAVAYAHSAEVVEMLSKGLKLVDGVEPEKSFNGGLLILVNEMPEKGKSSFSYQVTQEASIPNLLGVIEIIKKDLIATFERECGGDLEVFDDEENPAT